MDRFSTQELDELRRCTADELHDDAEAGGQKRDRYLAAVKCGALKPNKTAAWKDKAFRNWVKGATDRRVHKARAKGSARAERRDRKRMWRKVRRGRPEDLTAIRILAAGDGYGVASARYALSARVPSILGWTPIGRRGRRGTHGTRRHVRIRSVRTSRAGPDDGPPGESDADPDSQGRVGEVVGAACALYCPRELSLDRLLDLAGGDGALAESAFGQLPQLYADPINDGILARADARHAAGGLS